MKRAAFLVIIVLTFAPLSRAGDHLVSPADVQARMEEHARARASARDELGAHLASPALEKAVRAHLASLSDEDLQELQRRAEALRSDPAAGSAGHVVGGLLLGALTALALVIWYGSVMSRL